jgi:hypothetical protein
VGSIIINLFLVGIGVKNFIKREFQALPVILNVPFFDGDSFIVEKFVQMQGTHGLLFLIQGSKPTDNLNVSDIDSVNYIFFLS